MPRDERRRQKALARKATRRKEKKHASVREHVPSGRALLRVAASWPLYECLVSRSWQEPGELVQILVARSAGGEIAVAGFLVDLGCLGVKNALTHVLTSREYEEFRSSFASGQPMMRADIDLAAKIIDEGIAYARQLGFSPHPDYREAALLLADANPAACSTPIPLGVEGKPFFMPGPYDNVSKIVRQLERAVGPGNSHYALELDDAADVMDSLAASEEPSEQPTSFLPGLLRRLRP